MIKFLLRIDEETMNKAKALAEKEGLSLNKELNKLIKTSLINHYYEFESLSVYLKDLYKQTNKIINLQAKHYSLTTQHFVNQGYSDNLNPKMDRAYQKFLNYEDPFN